MAGLNLKKMFFSNSGVKVVLYVIEGDGFTYRCLISQNDSPYNIPSYRLAYHS